MLPSERRATQEVCLINNGDADLAAKFRKTPHRELGEVKLYE